ncbi:hypothetical protein BKA62DRAFT_689164 [Auriculariales sp. MPI-PUGE-AT-0066]|nr:hypothetical protein BKA62DRAFT_689164 [Auriculariales sp. MPI-PUGE-AT-0066]
MPNNWSCCNGNACDGDCCNGSCMPSGKTCCPNGKQCDSGTTCCGDSCAKSTESCCGGKVCTSGGGCCAGPSGLQTCADQCPNPTSAEISTHAGSTQGSNTGADTGPATAVADKSGGLSGAVIGGIVIAIILALGLAGVLALISFRFFKRRNTSEVSHVDRHSGPYSDGGGGGGSPNEQYAPPPPMAVHERNRSISASAASGIKESSEDTPPFDPYAMLEYRQSATSAASTSGVEASNGGKAPPSPVYNPFGIVRPSSPIRKGSLQGESSRALPAIPQQPAAPTASSYSTGNVPPSNVGLRVLSAEGMFGYVTADEKHGQSGQVEREDTQFHRFAAGEYSGSVAPTHPVTGVDDKSEDIDPRLSMIDSDTRSTRSTPSAAAAAAMALPLEVLQPHQREIVRSLQTNRVSATGILDIFSRMVAENERQRDQLEPDTASGMAEQDRAPPSYEYEKTQNRQ